MSLLLRYMISFCHKCGAVERFDLILEKFKPDLYKIKYRCPKCGYNNELVASKSDLDSLYRGEEK